jgi:hypothetical protein
MHESGIALIGLPAVSAFGPLLGAWQAFLVRDLVGARKKSWPEGHATLRSPAMSRSAAMRSACVEDEPHDLVLTELLALDDAALSGQFLGGNHLGGDDLAS